MLDVVRADKLFVADFLVFAFLSITAVLLSVRADTCFVVLRSRTDVFVLSMSVVRDTALCFFWGADVVSDFWRFEETVVVVPRRVAARDVSISSSANAA